MSVRMPKRESGTAYEQQIVQLIREWVAAAERDAYPVKRRMPRYYDLFRGLLTGRFHPHKHNIHIPMISSVILTDVARKVQTSWAVDPVLAFVGTDEPNDRLIARKIEGLVAAQFRDADMITKAVDFEFSADAYGRGIGMVGWNTDERDVQVMDVATTPLTKKKVVTMIKQKVTVFDGPQFEVIDPLDFIIEPGQVDIQKAMYAGHFYTLDLEEVLDLAEGDHPMFDNKRSIAKLQEEGGGYEGASMRLKEQRGMPILSSTMGYEGDDRSAYMRPVGLYDIVCRLPRELIPADGVAWRIVTIANDRYVMRNKPLPWFHQMKPYVSYAPMQDMHTFWSMGKAEMLEKIQLGANKFTNQDLDAIALRIDPSIVISRQANLSTQNPYIKPGRAFFVDGIPQQMMMPLPLGGEPGLGTNATETLWRWGQQGVGESQDATMGISTGGRTTAREFLGRQDAAGNRFAFESMLGENRWIEPLGNMFSALNRQFLGEDREIMILGESAKVDPDTGEPIPPRRITIGPEDLVGNYVARARGGALRLGLENKQQKLMLLTQAMAQNPATASAINWIMWSKMLARVFELPDASRIINTSEQAAKVMAQLQGQAGNAPVQAPVTGDGGDGGAGGMADVMNVLNGAQAA